MRIFLVLPVVWALAHERFGLALFISLIAGISDGIDGFLAKHFHWQSRLGSILDPIADKILLVASFSTLAFMGLLPLWLLWLVLARDLIIVCGGLLYHYTIGHFELTPLWSSKINTVMQIFLVLLVIVNQQWVANLDTLLEYTIFFVMLSVVYSGVEYMVIWGNKAWKQKTKP